MRRRALVFAALLVTATCFLGSAWADDIQDKDKTPGVTRAGLTKQKICTTKWGTDQRHVTAAMKRQVFALYGYSGYNDPHCVADAHGKTCEIDHLISRELGGADDVAAHCAGHQRVVVYGTAE